MWLQSGGQQRRETEDWKIVFTIWGPRDREGEAERRKVGTAADRKAQLVARA